MDSCQLCGIHFRSCYLGYSIRGNECDYRVCHLFSSEFLRVDGIAEVSRVDMDRTEADV